MLALVRFFLGFTLVFTALFLIFLVLIQRGRGGGLAGAFGGMGGQSAFGTKAGDVFTKITVGVAAFWIGLCILALNVLGQGQSLFSGTLGGNAPQAVMPQTGSQPQPPAGTPAVPDSSGGGLEIPAQPPAGESPKSDATKAEAPVTEATTPPAAAADAPPPAAPAEQAK
jgi:preprotein translocase subunit SecG